MANSYCENKSRKPVITRYDPSKNYMVQMVESLSSIDYPNENHIYVIESTGEKYIFYDGAFNLLTASQNPPFIIDFSAVYTGRSNIVYNYYYTDNVTYNKTYDEVVEALLEGRPIYLRYSSSNDTYYVPDIQVYDTYIMFTINMVFRNPSNTDHHIDMSTFVLYSTSSTGQSTRIDLYANYLAPESALSSTSSKAVQNKVVKQNIDRLDVLIQALDDATRTTTLQYVLDDITAPFPPAGSSTTQVATNVYMTVVSDPEYTYQYVNNLISNQKPVRAYVDFGSERKDYLDLASVGYDGIMFSGFATFDGSLYLTELVISQNITRIMTYIMA